MAYKKNIKTKEDDAHSSKTASYDKKAQAKYDKKQKVGRTKCRSAIGGQAVLEGVMMRGERSMATAVRNEDGDIVIESKRIKATKEKSVIYRIPFLRGVLNFFMTMVMGVSTLMRAAQVFDIEEKPSKSEQWMAKKFKVSAFQVAMVFAAILGMCLSIGLFFILPQVITSAISRAIGEVKPIFLNLIEGAVRLSIFIGYLSLTLLLKDIRRVFMYHGAEHKVISCYEHGLDMTVENAQKMSTIHDRCGTTFMVIVMVISILMFSLTGWTGSMWIRLAIRLALLPVVAGVSYEILKFLARFDNIFVKIIKAPGLLFQKLTTKQPTDEMVEVAMVAFETVRKMDADANIAEVSFDVKVLYSVAVAQVKSVLSDDKYAADIDWIFCEVLNVKRGALKSVGKILKSQMDKALEYADLRKTGKPLQQIFGYTDFYGNKIIVNEKVLCPRPETEMLCEAAAKVIKDSARAEEGFEVLDLCTGSGAIAITIKKLFPTVDVTASDISKDAIGVAQKNAAENGVKIVFKESDLFEKLDGKFDLIISNPPYITSEFCDRLDTEVKDFEPKLALDGGADGLDFYKRILQGIPLFVKPNATLMFECGFDQAQAIRDIVAQTLEKEVITSLAPDLEGIGRFVIIKFNS